jgi:hypothetical protein
MTIPARANIIKDTEFGAIVNAFINVIETADVKGQLLFTAGRIYLTFRFVLNEPVQEKQSFLLEIIDMPNGSQRFYCMYTESSSSDEKQNVMMFQDGVDFNIILPAYLDELYKAFNVSDSMQSTIRTASNAFHAQWLVDITKG